MKCALIRHGRTAGNERRAYVGRRTDEPLSKRGRDEVRAQGSFPPVDFVYVSPLKRARETAELLFPRARYQVVPGVDEMDFGAFEGRTAREMTDDADYRAWVDGWCNGPCPGGESRAMFEDRVEQAVRAIIADADARGLPAAIIVAHGGTAMAALDRLAVCPDERPDYFSWDTPPCGVWLSDVASTAEPSAAISGAPSYILENPCRTDILTAVRASGFEERTAIE